MSLLSLLFKPLAYLSLPVFLLHTLSNASPLARYYVRLGLYLSALGVCSVWGAISSVALTLAGRRFDVNWVVARSFYGLAGRLLGIKFEVEGEEYLSTRPAILVGNHQSMLDILYLGRILPKQSSILAKQELKYTPLLGQFMTLSGAVFVDRKNNARAVDSLAAAADTIKSRKISLWVFPEGTRTNHEKPDLLPFKKGAFHLAVQAGVPITPVVCENYWRCYHKGVLESGQLKIKVLPPVPTIGLTPGEVANLAVAIREQMLAALNEISGTRAAPSDRPIHVEDEKEGIAVETEPTGADVDAEVGPAPVSEAAASVDVRSMKREGTEVVPLSIDTASAIADSQRRDGSDKSTETEEDEGMVLVGHPPSQS